MRIFILIAAGLICASNIFFIFYFKKVIHYLVIAFDVLLAVATFIAIGRLNKELGTNIEESAYTNIVRLDTENDRIYYLKNGFEHFIKVEENEINYSDIKLDSTIIIKEYNTTAYEYWILGYRDDYTEYILK